MSGRKKILVSGSFGLVGSAVRRMSKNYSDLYEFIYTARSFSRHYDEYVCDLTSEQQVRELYNKTKPNYVIHLAARVGGIQGNLNGPADFYRENILMNTYMIDYAYRNNVEKFIGCSSICAMPDNLAEFHEDHMHDSPCYLANESYGFAKRAVDVQIRAYKKQYGQLNYMSLIPGNIAGIEDNYNLVSAHVLPALVHKMYLAKRDNKDFVVWGTGENLRQFVSSDDLAYVILELLTMNCQMPERLLVCGEKQHSIKEIVDILADVADFKGNIVYDSSKPGGQLARMANRTLFKKYFPDFEFTPMEKIVKDSWNWFCANYPNVRK